jgi:hypothetical protein
MLAYVCWHAPYFDIDVSEYENALLGFHEDLMAAPPAGLEASATYQISEVPWLSGRPGLVLHDFIGRFGCPEQRSGQTGALECARCSFLGLYYHLHGAEKPIAGARVTWLKRPRGIRYEQLCAKLSVSRQAS